MPRSMTLKESNEMAQRELVKTRSETVEDASLRGLEQANRRPATEADKSFANSFAKRTIEGKKPGDIRQRMPTTPKGQRWGGQITTERDELHCACGCLLSEHGDQHPKWCACTKKIGTKDESDLGSVDPEGNGILGPDQRTLLGAGDGRYRAVRKSRR